MEKQISRGSDLCVMCGEPVPEGTQVCKTCLGKIPTGGVSIDQAAQAIKAMSKAGTKGATPQLEKKYIRVEGKGDVLIDVVTGNAYYDYLIHEVMVVCNCNWDKAAAVVAYVNNVGGDPVEFIHRLPDLVHKPVPDVDELLETLERIRADEGKPRAFVCFPEGYQNRAARRRNEKNRKKGR